MSADTQGFTCVLADLVRAAGGDEPEPVWALCDRFGNFTGDVWTDYAPARAEAERRNAAILEARFA